MSLLPLTKPSHCDHYSLSTNPIGCKFETCLAPLFYQLALNQAQTKAFEFSLKLLLFSAKKTSKPWTFKVELIAFLTFVRNHRCKNFTFYK